MHGEALSRLCPTFHSHPFSPASCNTIPRTTVDPETLEMWLPLKQHTNGWIKILLIFTLLSTCALQVSFDNLGYRIHTKCVLILSPDCFTFLSYKLTDTVFSACRDGSSIQELLFLTSLSSSSMISISVAPSCSFLHFVLQDFGKCCLY